MRYRFTKRKEKKGNLKALWMDWMEIALLNATEFCDIRVYPMLFTIDATVSSINISIQSRYNTYFINKSYKIFILLFSLQALIISHKIRQFRYELINNGGNALNIAILPIK